MNFLKTIFSYLLEKRYIAIPKNAEGIIKDGAFSPCNLSSHILVDKGKNLILEKGKYKISLRDRDEVGENDPVGMFVVDNLRASYEKFWGSEKIINNYLCENRVNFFHEIFNTCKKYLRGRLIDVGCGSGDFLKIINENNIDCEIHGFDFSSSAIQRCKKNIPKGHFLNGNIYEMAYLDKMFNVIFCIEVLEHLEKPAEVLKEMLRICKRDGIIIITIPNGIYDDYIGHLNFWTESEFKELITGADLVNCHYLEDNKTMLFILKGNGN